MVLHVSLLLQQLGFLSHSLCKTNCKLVSFTCRPHNANSWLYTVSDSSTCTFGHCRQTLTLQKLYRFCFRSFGEHKLLECLLKAKYQSYQICLHRSNHCFATQYASNGCKLLWWQSCWNVSERHIRQLIQIWLAGSGCYKQLMFVMLIEEICQFKSSYSCKSTFDNLYSCVDLIHACHHFSGHFSIAIFSGSGTQRWLPHSYILTSPPTKLWLIQVFFQPGQQGLNENNTRCIWIAEKNRDVCTNWEVWN